MNIARLLDKTATIPSGSGGSGSHPAVPCSVCPADPATVIAYAQQGITCINLIYSTASLGAAVGSNVTVGDKTYTVVAVRKYDNSKLGGSVYVTACGEGV